MLVKHRAEEFVVRRIEVTVNPYPGGIAALLAGVLSKATTALKRDVDKELTVEPESTIADAALPIDTEHCADGGSAEMQVNGTLQYTLPGTGGARYPVVAPGKARPQRNTTAAG